MKPFAFRQRVGQINWKAISSVDIESVIDDNRIEELQSIVDDVAFCEVKSADIKGASVHDLKHLIRVKQLMIEYLLYCQESQLQLVHEMHGRNSALKSKNRELVGKVEASKEDIRIYRRQVAVLKSSIDKYKSMVDKQGSLESAPRVFNAISTRENVPPKQESTVTDSMAPLVESMLRHERQTREFVRDMIDEQRTALLRELECLRQGLPSVQIQQDRGWDTQHLPTESIREIREQRKVQITQSDHRERELLDTIHDLQMQIQHLKQQHSTTSGNSSTNPPAVSTRSVGVNTPPVATSATAEDTATRGLTLAFNVMSRSLRKNVHDSMRYAFRTWKNDLLQAKESSRLKIQADLTTARSETILLQEKVSVLMEQLETEKTQRTRLKVINETMEHQILELERRQPVRSPSPVASTRASAHDLFGSVGSVDEHVLLKEALQRVQDRVVEANADDVLDTLADELLDRVEIWNISSDVTDHQ